jgi:hypothetical protein
LKKSFPDDIVSAPAVYTKPLPVRGDRYRRGTYVDEWGCVFDNPLTGIIGVVHKPRILDWRDLEDYQPPEGILAVDKEAVNAFCRKTDRFVTSGTWQRPFERLQFLRTMEQALIDLIEQPRELADLLDRIHSLYLKEVEVWAQTEVDAIGLMDDWGTQDRMLASPKIFRKIFKPMYKEYVDVAKSRGKYVFMHSDGFITEIIPDLIEIGIDALNAQIFCMGVESLGRKFKGRITFWGEIDRQQILPYGTRRDIRKAVQDIWNSLYAEGGVIAQCEFGPGARPANIRAVFESWNAVPLRK